MKRSVVRRPTIGWHYVGRGTSARRVLAYRGTLSGAELRVHYGFDGWEEPIREVRLESIGPALAVAELPDLDDRLGRAGKPSRHAEVHRRVPRGLHRPP